MASFERRFAGTRRAQERDEPFLPLDRCAGTAHSMGIPDITLGKDRYQGQQHRCVVQPSRISGHNGREKPVRLSDPGHGAPDPRHDDPSLRH